MLALTREIGEYIDIVTSSGERIELCLLDSWKGRSRLGFSADKSVVILRREVLLSKQRGTTPLAERIAARKGKKSA